MPEVHCMYEYVHMHLHMHLKTCHAHAYASVYPQYLVKNEYILEIRMFCVPRVYPR